MTRFGLVKGHWGWEQSCFHYYLMQQTFGQLDYLTLPTNQKRGSRPHINAKAPSLHGVEPCILHANSASKPVLPVLQSYWERFVAPAAKAADSPLPVPLSKAELTQLVERDWRPDDNAAAKTLNPRHAARYLKLFERTASVP